MIHTTLSILTHPGPFARRGGLVMGYPEQVFVATNGAVQGLAAEGSQEKKLEALAETWKGGSCDEDLG